VWTKENCSAFFLRICFYLEAKTGIPHFLRNAMEENHLLAEDSSLPSSPTFIDVTLNLTLAVFLVA